MNVKTFACLPLLLLGVSVPAVAEDLHYNLVSFQEGASVSVPRDELVMQFSVNEKGAKRDDVISRNTDKLNRLLRLARAHSDFNVRVVGRRSDMWREYINQSWQDKGWQDEATVRVSSKNTGALLKFASQVQGFADLSNMNYQIADSTLKNLKENLTEQALARFRQRAEQITRALGQRNYRIVSLNIDNAGGNFARYAARYDSMALAASPKAVPVQDDAPGDAQVELNVSGQIQVGN